MSDAQSIRDGASSVASMSSSTTGRHASKAEQAAGGSRRMSVSRRPSVAGLSHQSNVGGRQGQQQSTVKFENTYRMQPDERHRFQPTMVSKILASLLESFLDGELYEAFKCSQIAQNLTEVVKGRMKELSLPRYKFISHVLIGQNTNQGINHASRSLWNTSTDNHASATYRNGSLFAIATVFAVYYE